MGSRVVTNMDSIPMKHFSFTLALIFLTFSPTSAETGLLVVGGEGGLQSVEFWTPPPLSAQCFLGDLPHLNFFHSLDSVNGEVILCSDSSCLRLEEGKWKEVAQLTEKRCQNCVLTLEMDMHIAYYRIRTKMIEMEGGGPLDRKKVTNKTFSLLWNWMHIYGSLIVENRLITQHTQKQT